MSETNTTSTAKKWWQSKTVWANAAMAAIATLADAAGFHIDPALQGLIVGAINVVLRGVTKTALTR